MNKMQSIALLAIFAAGAVCAYGQSVAAIDARNAGRPAAPSVESAKNAIRKYNLPVLTVRARLKGGEKGSCQFLPFSIAITGEDEPLRVSFSDNTPNGSGETIRNSLWSAAIVAAIQKESALKGVRISIDFKGGMDGPSAGAVMCLGIMSALDGRNFPDDFAMTGSILPDGTVGLVGGVPEKLDAAAKNPRIKRVAIPAFQRFARDSSGKWVDLFELGHRLGLELKPVESIGDAYRFLHRERPEPAALVSTLDVCREDSAFESSAAEIFQRRDAALRARIDGLSSNDLESLRAGWEWREISPLNAEQRFEEGAIFDALNLISRADANLSAYLESWKFFRRFDQSFLEEVQKSNKRHYSKFVEGKPKHEWPIETQLAFVDGFRAEISDLCERVLGWKSDRDDEEEEDAGDSETEAEPWRGMVPDPGTSDVSAQLLSLVLSARDEGQYRFMEEQTFDRDQLEDALKSGDRNIYQEIEYDRKKLFFLMCERFRKPSFTDVPLPVLNAGPETGAAMELFRKAWLIIDKTIETDVVDTMADNATAHKNAVRQYLIRENLDFAVYDAARRWGRLLLELLDEARMDGVEFDYPTWTESSFLFHCAELFAEASAQLMELDREMDNASFAAFVTDRARMTALRSMEDCRKSGIPCFGAVLSFQKAERARAGGGSSATSILSDYWKATMTAKSLVMAFKNGIGPEQGFNGYAETKEELEAKAAMSSFIDLLLNAETKPFLDSLPEAWAKNASDAAAAIAAKADDETWAMLQNLVKQGGVLLILQSPMLADMAFDDAEDPSESPLSKDDVQAVIENWGRRLLSIANAATRDAVAGGRLAEILTAPKRRLKGREDAGRIIPLPEVSSQRRDDGGVEISVPAWENAGALDGLVGTEADVFRAVRDKMVAENVIDLFSDSPSWKTQIAEWTDELLAEGPEGVRATLSALTDLLKKALRAADPEELTSAFEEFDWSILFGDDIAVEEVEDDAGAAFDAN